MSYRDLFIVLIRAFAAYQLLFAVLNCIELLNNYFFDVNMAVDIKEGALVAILVSLGFLFFLIYKTTWLVDFLKLDKGFESPRINLKNINSGNIAVIIIFFVGASLVIKSLVHFIISIFIYLDKGGIRFLSNDLNHLIYLFIGVILILKKNWMANLFVQEKI
ncbi:hypothetical protein SAMN05216474_1244 [Lishizhenia tianjinensis]|uniref:Uncharacterized protein n=1 Tax=Lishizhenia tianjinensis TaxID=477690 RepID=A0A1I6YWN8_9FLAO|nr:hypothetical protein [Lishizhenia tianjinensis]SFT54849.1 hypothetical protein SAMN05216474_1244 [Lishizhenia tianjinensis]